MSKPTGGFITVTDQETGFYAIYEKPKGEVELKLKQSALTKDNTLLSCVWKVANDKARELGCIA